MDKLSMAIIAMEAHIACTNDRLRQAWDIIHAELAEKPGSPHNSAMVPIPCPQYFIGSRCGIGFNKDCGMSPCTVQRH
jgi:hypothetical protein